MIDSNGVVVTDVHKATIRFLSPEEIRKQSTVQIDTVDIWDSLNNPVDGGLHDIRMGPISSKPTQTCGTCGLGFDCPGHIGHIELAAPAYHPILFPNLLRILKCVCFKCKRLRIHDDDATRFMWLFRLLAVENLSDMQMYDLLTGPVIEEGVVKDGEVSLSSQVKAARKQVMKEVRHRLSAAEEMYKKMHKDSIKEHLISQDIEKLTSDESYSSVPSVYPPLAGPKDGVPIDALGAMSSTKIEMWVELQKRFFDEARKKKCQHCNYDNSFTVKKSTDFTKVIVQWSPNQCSPFGEDENDGSDNLLFAAPKDTDIVEGRRRHMKKELYARDIEELVFSMFENDRRILSTVIPALHRSGPGLFFMRAVAVPSNRFRPIQPPMIGGDGRSGSISMLHPRTSSLLQLINASKNYEGVLFAEKDAGSKGAVSTPQQIKKERAEREKKVHEALHGLQVAVNCYLDREKAPNPSECAPGLRQLLERKQGLFRMKMMGKRVNYAARSVISPDPSINTNEVGMPIQFAMTLTFPEPLTNINVQWLRTLVINGPETYPGATAVRESNGRRRDLSYLDSEQRIALANSLAPITAAEVASGAVQPIVFRHARDNDVVLMNRQPTLHKPSIMAHRVRVLSGQRTIRMHYASCNSYNADFDGDEMNMHLPQDPLARAEAAKILNADAQYQVPKDGSPLRGLIQDHCGSGAILTSRGTFLTRAQYEQLVFIGLHRFLDDQAKVNAPVVAPNSLTKIVLKTGVRRVHMESPALIKPKELFTGKQVMTTVIKTITEAVAADVLQLLPKRLAGPNVRCFAGVYYQGKSRVPGDAWKAAEDGNQEEAQVLIEGGELLRGVLDKNQFGSVANSIIHIVHEILGPRASGGLLSAFGRVFSEFFRMHGFTCALSDMFLDEEGERQREAIIRSIHLAAARNLALFAAHFEPEETLANGHGAHSGLAMLADNEGADRGSKDGIHNLNAQEVVARGPILDSHVTEGVRKVFAARAKSPDGYIKLLDTLFKSVISKRSSAGADLCKGSRMLKPFPYNGFASMVTTGAKGSKVNFGMICAFLAQQELEGKRVPMMASGKTLPSFSAFDLSARPGGFIADRYLTGLRPQEFFFHCMSGREGLVDTAVKTARSGYLQRCIIKGMEGITVRYDGSVRDSDNLVVQFQYGEDGLDTIKQSSLDCMPDILRNFSSVAARHRPAITSDHIASGLAAAVALENGGRPDAKRSVLPPRSHGKGSDRDPISSTYIPHQTAGVVTEAFMRKVRDFISKQVAAGTIRRDDEPDTLVEAPSVNETGKKSKKSKKETTTIAKIDSRPTASAFELLMRLRFQSSLADAGEAVGVVAGQSIGEPSTQMTLNTFHLAGHGAANVTLGIPRLRELLQTASENMGTPMTTISIKGAESKDVEGARAQAVCKSLRKVTLFELVETLRVHTRRVKYASTSEEFHEYEIEATLCDMNLIQKALPGLSPQKIIGCLRTSFANDVMSKLYQLLFKVASRAELNGAKSSLGDATNDDEAAAARAISGALDSKSLRGVQLNKLIAGFHLASNSGKSKSAIETEIDAEMDNDVSKSLEPVHSLALDEMGSPLLALPPSDTAAIAKDDESTASGTSDSDSEGQSDADEDAAAAKLNNQLFSKKKKSSSSSSDSESSADSDDDETKKTSQRVKAAMDDIDAGSDVEAEDESEAEFDDDEKAVEPGNNMSDDEGSDNDVGDDVNKRKSKMGKRTRNGKMSADQTLDALIGSAVKFQSKSSRLLRSMDWNAKTKRFTLVLAHPVDKLVSKPILIADLVRKVAMTMPVQSVKGLASPQIISHTDLKKSSTGARTEVRCSGSNLRGIASISPDIVDHSRIMSNDIYAISQFYGIEAARQVFVKEMASVFGHYGITVDFRHLYLLGDSMTRGGKFRPFNRMGMAVHSSPFLQMTYETSSKFLGDCSLRSAVDDLNTPAASIVTGRVARLGTGAFDIMGSISKQTGAKAAAAVASSLKKEDEEPVVIEKRKLKFTA